MFDLLASIGTVEILQHIEKNPGMTSSEINMHLSKKGEGSLTTATIYRRLKELELAGFIIRDPPNSKSYVMTPKGTKILKDTIKSRPELMELTRSRRTLLHQIKEKEALNVQQLYQQVPLSPNTINRGLQALNRMGLIEQVKQEIKMKQKDESTMKKKKSHPGRPSKRHKLTKKGEEIYKKLEEEETL